MNNNLSYRTLKYYFNEYYTSRTKNLRMLKFDDVSYYSITPYLYSQKIINIISLYINTIESCIIDACACIGGDTINFCKNFKHVTAIEINKKRFEYLKNNINIFYIKNCTIINDDCNKVLKTKNTDVIYFDLPWNGKDYKKNKNIELCIGNFTLDDLCIINYNKCKLFCLKVPNNFNFINFKNELGFLFNIHIHDLYKFKIIILTKRKYPIRKIKNKIDYIK